jgi:tetratricopeptide (TPR) repeat protein
MRPPRREPGWWHALVRNAGGAWLLIATGLLSLAGCAALDKVTQSVAPPVKYTLAGADLQLRKNLERGLTQLKEENYDAATRSLDRAIWELERIENGRLRVDELADVYQALGDAYWGLRKREWAEEHWGMVTALRERARRGEGNHPSPPASLARAKAAYVGAEFRDTLAALRQALVDLEGMTDTPTRVRHLEEARCYLAFTYVALDKVERAKDELRRLWALDTSVAFCAGEAPPMIRRLISEVQRRPSGR